MRASISRACTALFFGANAFLGGCADLPRGYAAREWSLALREMQIVPVFPPREDVQVGDIHFLPESEFSTMDGLYPQSAGGFLPIGVFLDRIDTNAALSNFYSSRPSFPATDFGASDLTKSKQPTSANLWKSQGDVSRLRLVGFPEFFSATFSQGDASAIVPIEAVQVGVAAGFTRSKKVRVSLPVAESCALPLQQLMDEFENTAGKKDKVTKTVQKLVAAVPAQPGVSKVIGYIRLINEVYYARVIDVSVYDSKSQGGQLAVKLPLPVPNQPAAITAATSAPAPATGVPAQPPSGGTQETKEVLVTPQQAADELNKRLDAAMAATTPGVKIRFVSAAEGAVSLRRTYERPIAIGYRGLAYPVLQDGTIGSPTILIDWRPTAKGNSPGDTTPAAPSGHQPAKPSSTKPTVQPDQQGSSPNAAAPAGPSGQSQGRSQ